MRIAPKTLFNKKRRAIVARYFLLIIVLIFTFLPLLWLGLSAFKTNAEQYVRPPVIIGSTPGIVFDSIKDVADRSPIPPVKLIYNSTLIASVVTLLSIIVSLPAAYGMLRLSKRLKEIPLLLLCFRMIPEILVLLPYYMVIRKLGLIDTRFAVILVYLGIAIPFTIWTIRGFLQEIPIEVEEAALIDGCTTMQMLTKVVLPLSRPALVTVGLFNFMWSWNEFLYALILTRQEAVTIPPVMMLFMPRTLRLGMMNVGSAAVVSLISIIPIIIFALFMQKYLVRGMSMGAVKG